MSNIIATPENTYALLKKYGLYANKKFGQNFLISSNVIERILAVAGVSENDCVIEIGPGLGGMTQFLAERSGKVVSIEIDKKLHELIKNEMSKYDNFVLLEGDILKTDVLSVINEHSLGLTSKVCANLPYYITTPVILYLLENELPLDSITIMIQKEVADRITASPGTKDYGALTLAIEYYATANLAFLVPPSSFIPKPDVTSAVLNLKIRKEPPVSVKDKKKMFRIIKAAFGQRRKTLANAIINQCSFNITRDELVQIFESLNLSPDIRGEKLSLFEFAEISNLLDNHS